MKKNEVVAHKKLDNNHQQSKGNSSQEANELLSNILEHNNSFDQTNLVPNSSDLSSSITTSYDTNPIMSQYTTTLMETDPEKMWISPDLILDSSKVSNLFIKIFGYD